MTLIIKELIIRGNVIKDDSETEQNPIYNKELLRYLDSMKKSIKKECLEVISSKIESKSRR